MDLTKLTDDRLVQLCREGNARDPRLFAELFRRHRDTIWRLCFQQFRNRQDAEDLCQEAFLKAFRGLRRFEGRASFSSWLYQIALNLCRNERRRRSRRPSEVDSPMALDLQVMASTPPADTLLIRRQLHGRVSQALACLRPQDVEILNLVEWEGKSYPEVAELLGVGLSAAKMRTQRARIALKAAFHEIEKEGRT